MRRPPKSSTTPTKPRRRLGIRIGTHRDSPRARLRLHHRLLGALLLQRLLELRRRRVRLGAHDAATPGTLDGFCVLVVLLTDGRDKLAEVVAVLRAHRGERNGRRGLLVHEGAKTRLRLDDAIGDVHLAADSRQPHDELHGRGDEHDDTRVRQ